jgi:hypothetical protein
MSSKDIPLDAFVRRIAREAEKNFDRHGDAGIRPHHCAVGNRLLCVE